MSSRRFTVEDLWSLERLGAPAVSPDGRFVALVATRYPREENRGVGDLWLVAADGAEEPRRLTWNAGSEKSPAWRRDSRHLAFVSKRGEDPAQLYRLPMTGGEAEPLTDLPIAVLDVKYFGDGRRIAFTASTWPDLGDDMEAVKKRVEERKDDKTKVKTCDRRLLRYWDEYRTDGRLPHVFELDLGSREIRDLMPGLDVLNSFMSFEWDLSPDGSQIAFVANTTEPPWRRISMELHLLDVESGEIRRVGGTGGGHVRDMDPAYSADGRYLLFGRKERIDVSPDPSPLQRYDTRTGEIRDLTGGWDRQPSGWRTTADGETVVFHAQDRGRSNLYAMPIGGGEPRLLLRGGATAGVDVGTDGRLFYLRDSLLEPEELWSAGLDGGEPRRLTSFHDERVRGIDFGTVEDVTFEGAGGDEVQMWVLHPPGFDRTKKYPLVLIVHGGPHSAWLDTFHYRWATALFSAQGYVAAALNFHGSTGFGHDFTASIQGEHARLPFEDVMKATDHLLERGYVDGSRMAVAGGSFGGYLVSWILGHTDRYAALVNHAGVYDLMGQSASDYGWSRGQSYGAEAWEDPERIDLYSPSRYAANFATPTLVLHGELDYRVPVTQGLQLYHVLQGKGVPSRIVIFPNENHWISRPQAAEVWWREVLGWLDRYIGKGGEDDEAH